MYTQYIRDGQEMVQHAEFLKREYVFPIDILKLNKINPNQIHMGCHIYLHPIPTYHNHDWHSQIHL